MEKSNFFGTVILGVAVGVAIGILIAPDKGSETRKKLMNGAQDLADDIKEKLNEGAEKFQGMKELVETNIEQLKEKASASVEKFGSRAGQAMS